MKGKHLPAHDKQIHTSLKNTEKFTRFGEFLTDEQVRKHFDQVRKGSIPIKFINAHELFDDNLFIANKIIYKRILDPSKKDNSDERIGALKTFFKNKDPPLLILAMKILREIWMIWLFFLNLIILLLLNQKIKFL